MQPLSLIRSELRSLLTRGDNKWIRYDFKNGIKELLNRKFGWKLKIKLDDSTSICSAYDAEYAMNLGMVTDEFKKLKIAFPQDFLRYLDTNNAKIIV